MKVVWIVLIKITFVTIVKIKQNVNIKDLRKKLICPDGFQPFFFKQYWPSIANDLGNMVRQAFIQGHGDPALTDTLILPIPKIDHLKHLRDFRPISLCNVTFKV